MTAKIVTPIELKRGTVYWLERKDGDIVKVTLNGIDRNTKQSQGLLGKHAYDFFVEPFRFMSPAYYLHESTFGETWRCWSHKPTDEQREEAEWDG